MSLSAGIDSGSWVCEDRENNIWKYRTSNGGFLSGGFAFIKNPSGSSPEFGWYCFDNNGVMKICWIKTEGDIWYHAHEIQDGNLGMLETGWVTCAGDNRIYYLDEKTAVMQSGWIGFVNSLAAVDYYYFARLEDTYKQNWFLNTALGRWMYDKMGGRSYGSMYVNEKTPDGHLVDTEGKRTDG